MDLKSTLIILVTINTPNKVPKLKNKTHLS